MRRFFQKLVADGAGNPDEAVITGLVSVLAYVGMGVYRLVHSGELAFQDFGIGFGAMAGGVGAWMKLKQEQTSKSPPEQAPQ